MKQISGLIKKAQNSSFYLWILNVILARVVPFNKPHGFKIVALTPDSVTMKGPYKKSNFNHLKGLHACFLATMSEYISGLTLLLNLPPDEYRIILRSIGMTYHYQAKKDVQTTFKLSTTEIAAIKEELKQKESTYREYKVEILDADKNLISTGLINWQIKPWNKVKTQR